MARICDIKVGQKIEIVKGKTSPGAFNFPHAERFVGRKTVVKHIDDEWGAVWITVDIEHGWQFPPDWIKIIKEKKEKPVETRKTNKEVKTKYAVLDVEGCAGISDYFEDISQVFDVINKWEGYDRDEVVEFFEKGYYKIIEVKELDVKIEVPKPVVKIVG